MRHQSKLTFIFLCCLSFAQISLCAKDKTEPTNAEELAAKKAAAQKIVDEQFAKWKATLSPAQQKWETTLEENLGSFYLPIYKQGRMKGRKSAWDYVQDDPALPRVLLIGDSISRAYTLKVRSDLAGKANVHRAPANCGPTITGLKKMDVWLGDGQWDIIHFNFGIHDRKTPVPDYQQRLEEIITRLKKTNAQLIWATTTPVKAGCPHTKNADLVVRNTAAAKLMKKHHIPINDLYTWIFPNLDKYQLSKDVHFNSAGNQHLGEKVSQAILQSLKNK